jgi:hypothetical protein
MGLFVPRRHTAYPEGFIGFTVFEIRSFDRIEGFGFRGGRLVPSVSPKRKLIDE